MTLLTKNWIIIKRRYSCRVDSIALIVFSVITLRQVNLKRFESVKESIFTLLDKKGYCKAKIKVDNVYEKDKNTYLDLTVYKGQRFIISKKIGTPELKERIKDLKYYSNMYIDSIKNVLKDEGVWKDISVSLEYDYGGYILYIYGLKTFPFTYFFSFNRYRDSYSAYFYIETRYVKTEYKQANQVKLFIFSLNIPLLLDITSVNTFSFADNFLFTTEEKIYKKNSGIYIGYFTNLDHQYIFKNSLHLSLKNTFFSIGYSKDESYFSFETLDSMNLYKRFYNLFFKSLITYYRSNDTLFPSSPYFLGEKGIKGYYPYKANTFVSMKNSLFLFYMSSLNPFVFFDAGLSERLFMGTGIGIRISYNRTILSLALAYPVNVKHGDFMFHINFKGVL